MNILIIRFSALGDLVTLEPTLRAIRTFYPVAHITFLTSELGSALYKDTGYFDESIVHKQINITKEQLKKHFYELIFNLHCNNLSHKLVRSTMHRQIINISANWLQKILNIKVKGKPLRHMLEQSGIKHEHLDEYFSNSESKIIQLPYQQKLQDIDQFKIAISTGSSPRWTSKKWGLDNFKNLIERLTEKNYYVILVGTETELSDAETITAEIKSNILNLVSLTDLTELKNILGSVDLYVGNDSGPTHVAAATSTDTLTIFGSTGIEHAPRKEIYYGTHHVIEPDNAITCHPCYKPDCPKNMECMKSISVEQVHQKIMELIDD